MVSKSRLVVAANYVYFDQATKADGNAPVGLCLLP
jgi:hypothetical protein